MIIVWDVGKWLEHDRFPNWRRLFASNMEKCATRDNGHVHFVRRRPIYGEMNLFLPVDPNYDPTLFIPVAAHDDYRNF